MNNISLMGSLLILAAVFVLILIGKIVAHLVSIVVLGGAIILVAYALYAQMKRPPT